MSGKTKEELQRMTAKEIKAYAKEIGCCLGYDASRKETAINAIMAYQEHNGMTVDLKPCPFCGGEAKSRGAFNELLNEVDGWYVYCTNDRCQCMPETVVYDTEAEAVAAWNTRHEGTCRMEPLNAFYTDLNGLNQTEWCVCSNCGTASPIDATYCCECGRRIIR